MARGELARFGHFAPTLREPPCSTLGLSIRPNRSNVLCTSSPFLSFFPFIAVRGRDEFEWNGLHFPKGQRVMSDLYGTDHDARLWASPNEFRAERFRECKASAFAFIPQGGGDHTTITAARANGLPSSSLGSCKTSGQVDELRGARTRPRYQIIESSGDSEKPIRYKECKAYI